MTKASTTARGYGHRHQQERKRWLPHVEAGQVFCARCRRLILPGEPWDLGHVDGDKSRWAGPEHRRCNRATELHGLKRRRVNEAAAHPRLEDLAGLEYVGTWSRIWSDLGPNQYAIVCGKVVRGPAEA
jgi:hypothetical protein